MAHTERARFNFKLRRSGGDKPFVYAEPLDGGLTILNPKQSYLRDAANYRILCFDLPDTVGWDQAEKVVNFLNENIASISVTEMIDQGH